MSLFMQNHYIGRCIHGFILGFPCIQRGMNYVFVFYDMYSNMVLFHSMQKDD
jgi:hypothetical protein